MIVFRTVFFVVVSLAAGLVSRLARVHIDSLREKVSEKTAELEKSYQELKDLQEARDFLTNTIIHDLRSSLTSTILSCEVLDRKYDDVLKDDGKVLMDTALSSAKRMHVMVSNILDVYAADRKALEPKREPWEVEAALRQAAADFQLQATLRKISLCVEAPGELPPVEADGELMRRVLANLLYNAVGYTPAGGAVVLGASRRGGAVEVAVSNTGSYIAPEWHQKIFEKFARLESGSAARSGSGLGLAFCRMAVEAHGGKIWVASARDGDECSTTFRFTVPAAPEG